MVTIYSKALAFPKHQSQLQLILCQCPIFQKPELGTEQRGQRWKHNFSSTSNSIFQICSECSHVSDSPREHSKHRKWVDIGWLSDKHFSFYRTHFTEEKNAKCIICNDLLLDNGKLFIHTSRAPYCCTRCKKPFACAGLKRMHRCSDNLLKN